MLCFCIRCAVSHLTSYLSHQQVANSSQKLTSQLICPKCWQSMVPSPSSYPTALHSPPAGSQHPLSKVIGSTCSAIAVCQSLEWPLASIELTPVVRHERATKPICHTTISQAAGTGNSKRKKFQNPMGHKP